MRLRRMALAPRLDQVAILRQIIGHIDGEPVYAICGADSEGAGNGKDGANNGTGKDGSEGGSGNADGGKDDDDEDDDDEDERPPKDPKDYRAWAANRKLQKEAARRRVENKKLREEKEAQAKELEDIKAKDMSELEKAQTASSKAEITIKELNVKNEEMQVELAFLKFPRDKYDWHDAGAALALLDRADLTLNEDGTVDGMTAAIKQLAKTYKFLLKTPGSNDGDESKDKDGKEGNGSTGGSFGNSGGRGGDERKAFQDKAVSRFRLN